MCLRKCRKMWIVTLIIFNLVQGTTFALPDGDVITSPDYPNDYPNNYHTEHTVSVPDGYKTFITFQGFALETDDSCGRDYLQICDKNKMCRQKLCGTSLPDPIIFHTSSVTIVFRSDGNNSMKGFSLSYKKVKGACSENIEIEEDCICSNTFCEVASTCINGTTCIQACNENEKISEECMCSNELCGVTSSCINGTTCMPACSENVEISEECVCSNEVCGANHTCASGLTCAQGWEQVTELKDQIPEFLFDCLTKKDPWISPCSEFRQYFMIFDSHGNFFHEKTAQGDNYSKYLTASTKKARKPMGKQMIEMGGHPNYLFQLEEVDQNKGTFYIGTNATGSGQLLVAGNEGNSSLLLREDHCGKESSAPITVSPVMAIVSTTTTAFTEPSVSSMTTVGFTESPTTAIAISNAAPNMNYFCDQAQWRLWKIDGRFLLIESVNKPGSFLNLDPVTHKVRLGMPEKLTGIYSSFISHMTLDRSAGRPAEAGIGAEAYGDVMVHYFGRDGSALSGYICDHGWGQKSAISVCKHLGFATGIPTFDGRYSSINTPEYAVSEVKCDSENLDECKVRTICGTSLSCLTQNSMKAFGGKGYACNTGSATDVAGVVCGDEAQIFNVLKQEATCNRASRASDKKSVASMFSVHKQIKTVGSSMFENKHWSEYLLPMPMAVSLISALLLVSSQNDREVELIKPEVGEWVHLKHIYLQPNLLLLSQHVQENFMLSTVKMSVINENTKRIHRNMIQALQNAFSPVEFDYKTFLPRNLKRIATDAATNKEVTEQVCTAFNTTNQIIYELVQALKSTQGYQQNKKATTEKALKILNSTLESNKREYEEKMLLKQEYDAAVKTSRKAYFDAAKAAMNAKCVEDEEGDGYGTAECDNCKWIEPVKTDICKPNKTDNVCVEWNDPTCEEYESVCVEYGRVCTEEKNECVNYEKVCTGGMENICTGGYDLQCAEYENVCTPAPSQSFSNVIHSKYWPSNYPNSHDETHKLAVREGYDIYIQFHRFATEECCDWVQICDQNNTCGSKISGYYLPGPFNIPTSNATVKFHTDGSRVTSGFQLSYRPAGSVCEQRCIKNEKICRKFEQSCKSEETQCQSKEMKCIKDEKMCNKTESRCKKLSPDIKCNKTTFVCTEHKYIPEVSGSYCVDSKNQGKCTKCKWIDEVSKNLKSVADVTLKMQQSVLNDESSYSGVVGVIGDLVNQVEIIEQDVQNYKKWKAIYQIVPHIDNGTKMDNGTKAMNNGSQSTKLVIDANRTIDSTLKLTKLSVDLKIDLLSQMKLPIAKKSSDNALEVKGLLENLITKKVEKVADMTEEEKVSVITLFTKGKSILMEANELKAKHEVAITKSSVGGDHKTGEQASILLENLSNRHKTEKVIESLSNRMSNAIREMFKEDLEKQDINSIITKLVECSRYLNFLNEQWLQLRMFFMKLTEFLKIMQLKMKEMSELYNDIGVNIPRKQLGQSRTFKEEMQRSIIDGFSNNIFVGRVAHFYTKIAEGGLLEKMALIGNYLEKVDDPAMFERMKKYIEDESVMTQEKIKMEVSKEEAVASDKIMKDVMSIKNDLACSLKDVDSLSDETVITIAAAIAVNQAENTQLNVDIATSEVSPDERESMLDNGLLDEVPLDLQKTYEEIENNDQSNDLGLAEYDIFG